LAKARLLRQYLADYNKQLAKAQGEYLDRYEAYKGQYDQYAQQENAYNQQIEQYNAVMKAGLSPGSIFEDESGLKTVDQKGNVVPYQSYTPPILAEIGVQSNQPYKINGNWFIDVAKESVDYSNPDNPQTITTTERQWIPVVAQHPGAAPTAPAEPAAPTEVKKPNLTQGDIREMQNPGLDQAALAQQAARGYLGKSALAGDTPTTRNSAFANLGGDDPNQLHDAGILARTLAGQL
jgi:hypothetical protein